MFFGMVLCMRGKAICRLLGRFSSDDLITAVDQSNCSTGEGHIKRLADRNSPRGFWSERPLPQTMTRPMVKDAPEASARDIVMHIAHAPFQTAG